MIDFGTRLQDDGILIVDLRGELDSATCDYFFDCMQDEIDSGHRNIVVDCSQLGLISSMGLGMLIRARSRLHTNQGRVYISGLHGMVAEAFRITNLDQLFDIFSTSDEAVAALRASLK